MRDHIHGTASEDRVTLRAEALFTGARGAPVLPTTSRREEPTVHTPAGGSSDPADITPAREELMFDPHQISARLAVVAGVALLAALIVPSAVAVEPMLEGGNKLGSGIKATPEIGAAGKPPIVVDAPASSFDWSAALVLVLIALTVFVGVLAAHHGAGRRGRRHAAG